MKKQKPDPLIPERTVRGMKETLKILVSQTHMLLSHNLFEWPDEDYATYMTLTEMSGHILMNNPTKKQLLAVLVVWGRFCKSVSERVPVEELKVKALALHESTIAPYAKWIEEEDEHGRQRKNPTDD